MKIVIMNKSQLKTNKINNKKTLNNYFKNILIIILILLICKSYNLKIKLNTKIK